jgi:hypothetical protein
MQRGIHNFDGWGAVREADREGGLVGSPCPLNPHDEKNWTDTHAGPVLQEQGREWSLMIFYARATRGLRRPSPGLMARLCVPVGGRVRKFRAVKDHSAPISRRERGSLEEGRDSWHGLCARRAPTMKRWSLDARIGDQHQPSRWMR